MPRAKKLSPSPIHFDVSSLRQCDETSTIDAVPDGISIDPHGAIGAIVVVDPGATAGIVRFVAWHTPSFGARWQVESAQTVRARAPFGREFALAVEGELAATARRRTLLVVEDAWLARGSRANVATTASIARYVGAAIALASLAGVPSWRVHPVTWRSRVLGGRPDRDAGKALAMARARVACPGVELSEHAADAICIGLYATQRLGGVAR